MTVRCEWNPEKNRMARNGDPYHGDADLVVYRNGRDDLFFVCRDCRAQCFAGQQDPPSVPPRQHRYSRYELLDAIDKALAAGFAR